MVGYITKIFLKLLFKKGSNLSLLSCLMELPSINGLLILDLVFFSDSIWNICLAYSVYGFADWLGIGSWMSLLSIEIMSIYFWSTFFIFLDSLSWLFPSLKINSSDRLFIFFSGYCVISCEYLHISWNLHLFCIKYLHMILILGS